MRGPEFPPSKARPFVVKQRMLMTRVVYAFLRQQAAIVADQVGELAGLSKAEGESIIDHILATLAFSWKALISQVEPIIAVVAVAGGETALSALSEGFVERFGEGMRVRAADYARGRSAELVGMRREGSLFVRNPNARWQITETTRGMIRAQVTDAIEKGKSTKQLKKELLDSHAFSRSRAQSIARTEVARADSEGAMAGWRSTGLVHGKDWVTAGDDKVSPPCVRNGSTGIVELNWDYGGGVIAPPQHPNCRCTLVPELLDSVERPL